MGLFFRPIKKIGSAIWKGIVATMRFVGDTTKRVVTTIQKGIWSLLQGIWRFVCDKIPGGSVFTLVLLFNLAALLSNGILHTAGVIGLVTCVSIAFLYGTAPRRFQEFLMNKVNSLMWGSDVVVTILLTILGFTAGPTEAAVGLFLGLNWSAMVALLRWMANRRVNALRPPTPAAIPMAA